MQTLDTIDFHITRTWLRLCAARKTGKPVTEHWHTIDGLLDQRLEYQGDNGG